MNTVNTRTYITQAVQNTHTGIDTHADADANNAYLGGAAGRNEVGRHVAAGNGANHREGERHQGKEGPDDDHRVPGQGRSGAAGPRHGVDPHENSGQRRGKHQRIEDRVPHLT